MTSNLYEGTCGSTYYNDANGYVACVLANCTKAYPQPVSGGCAPPSNQFNYNGTDYGVLKVLTEKLTGVTFEQYVHTALFVPSGVNNPNLAATDLANANCNPDLSPSSVQPLYYCSRTNDTGIQEANDRPRSLAVCGAGAMQAAVWQLDLFTRALMTGVQGGSPILTANDRKTMLTAGMFGGPSAYPALGQVFAKNGGFSMDCNQRGMVSAIVMAPEINTQLAVIVNTGGDPATTPSNMPGALFDGLVRMHSTPLGVFSARNRDTDFGEMCLDGPGAALAGLNPNGSGVNVRRCGSPVANNMMFVQLDVGGGEFMLQSAKSGYCVNVSGGSTADNADIIQWGCDGSSNELFSFSPTSGGYGHIVGKNSGKCLDVSGGSIHSGAKIVQNTCSSSKLQDFKLQPDQPTGATNITAMQTSTFAAAPLSDGRLQLWAITTDNKLISEWKTDPDPNAQWSGWQAFQAPAPSPVQQIAAAPLSDGRLELWAVTIDNRLFSEWKTETDSHGPWSCWQQDSQVPGPVQQIAAASLSDGRIQLWAVTTDNKLISEWKADTDPNGPWSGWQLFPAPEPVLQSAAGRLSDGRLQLWAVTTDNKLISEWKTDTDTHGPWSGWEAFPASDPIAQIATASLPDGRLQLWAITTDNRLISEWKTSTDPHGSWSGWQAFLAPGPVQQFAAAPLSDGRLQLWAVTTEDSVFSEWKTDKDPKASWSSWQALQ